MQPEPLLQRHAPDWVSPLSVIKRSCYQEKLETSATEKRKADYKRVLL